MSTVDFSPLSPLPMLDPMYPEPGGSTALNTSFDDYLQRANTPATPPQADDRQSNPRDADRLPPPKAENSRALNGGNDAAQQQQPSRDQEPSREAAPRTEDHPSRSTEVSSSAPVGESHGQNNPNAATQAESKDRGVKPSENNAVQEKKKSEGKKPNSKAAAKSAVEAPQNAAAMLAHHAERQSKGVSEKEAVSPASSDETDLLTKAPEQNSQPGDPAAENAKNAQADAAAAMLAAVKKEVKAFPKMLLAAENRPAEAETADANNLEVGDEKTGPKNSQEAAAESKKSTRRQNPAVEKQPAVSTAQILETVSATAGKAAASAAQGPSAVPQAAANVLQSVLDAPKNAEKQTKTEDSTGNLADVRTNAAALSSTASSAREGGSATATAGSDSASPSVRAQFIGRVERAFVAMGERDGSVRLKLSPPELGVLTLEVSVRNGVLKARVEAETPAAKSLLLDNLPVLRERLAQQNIHVQQFDVDLMDRSPGGMSQQTFGQADSDSRQSGLPSPRANSAENAALGSTSAPSALQRPGMGGSLNVFV